MRSIQRIEHGISEARLRRLWEGERQPRCRNRHTSQIEHDDEADQKKQATQRNRPLSLQSLDARGRNTGGCESRAKVFRLVHLDGHSFRQIETPRRKLETLRNGHRTKRNRPQWHRVRSLGPDMQHARDDVDVDTLGKRALAVEQGCSQPWAWLLRIIAPS